MTQACFNIKLSLERESLKKKKSSGRSVSSLEYVISLPNQGQTASEMKSSVLLHFLHPKTKAHILYLRSTPIIGLILQLQQPLSMLGTTNKVQETGR